MSEARSRIDALLNFSGPDSTPQRAHGTGATSAQIPYVPTSSQAPQGAGNPPDAMVYVDGSQVPPGADGSIAIDVTPRGFSRRQAESERAAEHGGNGRVGGAHGEHGAHNGPTGPRHGGAGGHDPVEHVKGLGRHPAQVDISDPHGKHHVPYTIHKNPDGSVDVIVPKGPGHPHETRIHVPPGKHVDLNLAEDGHGHVKVQVHPAAPPDAKHGDGAGAGDHGKGAGTTQPSAPKAPGGGGPSGGGGGPSGGGPSSGGGGPSGGGGAPPSNHPGSGGGTRTADPEAMRKLGDDIDRSTGSQMDALKQQTQGIDVGYPAFGVLGFPLNMAHGSVRDDAVKYLSDGRDQLSQWRDTLYGNAANWSGADNSSSM